VDDLFAARDLRPFYVIGAFDGEAMSRYFLEAALRRSIVRRSRSRAWPLHVRPWICPCRFAGGLGCRTAANATVEQPRPFGYVVGDLLAQRVLLELNGRPFEPAALPPANASARGWSAGPRGSNRHRMARGG
jgi:hypothetical protein